jgi:hypothetical protein
LSTTVQPPVPVGQERTVFGLGGGAGGFVVVVGVVGVVAVGSSGGWIVVATVLEIGPVATIVLCGELSLGEK